MAVIEVQNLKKYFGKTRAVDDISFVIDKGEIFGFLGPNGAGKTTTIRCMMNFIKPTGGKINILQKDAQKDSEELKSKIGFLPGNVRLYDNWTGADHIKFLERINCRSNLVQELIEKLNFNPRIKVKNLSTGNKQKLGLILALMGDPELLILDEPTVGLDPLLQNQIYLILEELQKKGTTIFMSSHNLSEVERLCNRVGIIKDGKLAALESIGNLKSKRMHVIEIHFEGAVNVNEFIFDGVEVAQTLHDGLILNVKGDINSVVKKIANLQIKDLSISHATLEEVFLEFYRDNSINQSNNQLNQPVAQQQKQSAWDDLEDIPKL